MGPDEKRGSIRAGRGRAVWAGPRETEEGVFRALREAGV